jgi:hypothetical protein
MARPRKDNTEGFGSDSFLDIVCNMVGIIILLVLVVGLRIKDAPISAAETASTEAAADASPLSPALEPLQDSVHSQQAALANADQEKQALEEQLRTARRAAEAEEQQGRRLNDQLTRAQQWQNDLQQALLAKQQQLRALAAAVQAVPGARPAKTVQLEAYPAPYLKKVEGKEAHFRVLGGRVVYVPFEELLEKAAPDARDKFFLSPGSTEIESMVGPVHGFNVSYVLRRNKGMLDYCFTFIPLSDRLGETVGEALAPSSQFRRILASKDPKSTTITFWTYQDSFEGFRQLRKEAYLLGYAVANRPMRIGQLIQASRDGSRSETQ